MHKQCMLLCKYDDGCYCFNYCFLTLAPVSLQYPAFFHDRSVHDADMHVEKHVGTGFKLTIWHYWKWWSRPLRGAEYTRRANAEYPLLVSLAALI